MSLSAGQRFGADAYLVSVPKSGRTWLRVLIQSYLCAWDGREFAVHVQAFSNPAIPRVLYTHDRFEHAQERRWYVRARGRNLIPPGLARRHPILLLARDPRDVVVSLYYQLNRREKTRKRYEGTLSEMIRDRRRGIHSMINVMNAWLKEWDGRPDFLMVRYENLRRDVAPEARRILEFLGVTPVDEALLKHAIEFSSFDNMKAMERAGAFAEGRLKAGDSQDPESFKVRKGKIGGYRDTLPAEDVAYLDEAMERLDPRYGYCAAAPGTKGVPASGAG
jgi:hypothetical protein